MTSLDSSFWVPCSFDDLARLLFIVGHRITEMNPTNEETRRLPRLPAALVAERVPVPQAVARLP